jgi:acetyl-CoA carboxylase biotin carboxyl carrier protein
MDEAKLKRLIRLVEESDIDELEIRPFGRIRIAKRRADGLGTVATVPVAAAAASPPPAAAASSAPEEATPTVAEENEREPGLVAIVSPMVGTFYASPAPGAKPYVSEGERVGVGQVVCIVEAMKLMNEVQSEVAGSIRRICVENGQAVEYGTELFLVATG